jgi:hypothetical protein
MSAFDVHLYFSGNVTKQVEKYLLSHDVYRLHSFAYAKHAIEYLELADTMGKRVTMLVDSGAFTSWSIGRPVQLADLLAYNDDLLRRFGHHNLLFIALDVIPGERGRRATDVEITQAVEHSYANFCTMQQHYPRNYVLPVFHSGEDSALRDAYLARTDYIALSMDQGMSERDRLQWAVRTAVGGYKYHGLAATGNRMVTEVPWYSVDSSSWLTVSNMGNILLPTTSDRFRTLAVSQESPQRRDAGAHVDTISAVEREALIRYIEQNGFDLAGMRNDYDARRLWNIYQWLNTPWRRNIQRPGDLFSA